MPSLHQPFISNHTLQFRTHAFAHQKERILFSLFFLAQKTKAKGDEASVVDGREGADLLPEDFEWFGKSIREMAHRYNFFFR
jgi:hypothetical protein